LNKHLFIKVILYSARRFDGAAAMLRAESYHHMRRLVAWLALSGNAFAAAIHIACSRVAGAEKVSLLTIIDAHCGTAYIT